MAERWFGFPVPPEMLTKLTGKLNYFPSLWIYNAEACLGLQTSYILCLSLGYYSPYNTWHSWHGIWKFAMLFTGFQFGFFTKWKKLDTHLYSSALDVTYSTFMYRGNILSDNLKKWRPDVIFKTFYYLVSNQSGWDSSITPSLHFLPWSSQKKHWVKIQDLSPTVQVLISLGCRIWKAGQSCRIMTRTDNFCPLVTYNF